MESFEPGVRVGLKFKRGDLLGRCGKTGTGSPHCHYEVMRDKPKKSFAQYVWGLSTEEVRALYLDPHHHGIDQPNNLPMKYNTLGYDFLSPIVDGKRKGFHPGADLNWGSGADDLGFEIRATTDGTIVYMGLNPNDGSWGNHLWWKEETDMGQIYEGYLIQETQESGAFAYVQKGKKRVITSDRAGLAALTVQGLKSPFQALTKSEWDAIPSGNNF